MQNVNLFDLQERLLKLELEVNKLATKIKEENDRNFKKNPLDNSSEIDTQLILTSENNETSILFQDKKTNGSTHRLGELKTSTLSNQINKFSLCSGKNVSLELNASKQLLLFSDSSILLNAKNISIESESIDISGEMLAKIRYAGPFEWQSGQPKLRLIHKEDGFPVITRIKGNLREGMNEIHLFIESKDNHWYLDVRSKKSQKIIVQVICIGKV